MSLLNALLKGNHDEIAKSISFGVIRHSHPIAESAEQALESEVEAVVRGATKDLLFAEIYDSVSELAEKQDVLTALRNLVDRQVLQVTQFKPAKLYGIRVGQLDQVKAAPALSELKDTNRRPLFSGSPKLQKVDLDTLLQDLKQRKLGLEELQPSPADIEHAVKRFIMIQTGVSEDLRARALRKAKKAFMDAQEQYKNGLIGLLPGQKRKGNRKPKVPPPVLAAVTDVMSEASRNHWDVNTAYAAFIAECSAKGLTPMAKGSFRNRFVASVEMSGVVANG